MPIRTKVYFYLYKQPIVLLLEIVDDFINEKKWYFGLFGLVLTPVPPQVLNPSELDLSVNF